MFKKKGKAFLKLKVWAHTSECQRREVMRVSLKFKYITSATFINEWWKTELPNTGTWASKIKFLFLKGLHVWFPPFATRITSVVSLLRPSSLNRTPRQNGKHFHCWEITKEYSLVRMPNTMEQFYTYRKKH